MYSTERNALISNGLATPLSNQPEIPISNVAPVQVKPVMRTIVGQKKDSFDNDQEPEVKY